MPLLLGTGPRAYQESRATRAFRPQGYNCAASPDLTTTALPEWVDYNGPMNDTYYVLIFSQATDTFMDYIGMDKEYRDRTALSVFILKNRLARVFLG